ncbi:dNTP triphosphohydrolase [Flavobacteriaceae bacterium Ap0902]|nr:dNTP triphosphohydrolase [Flavobacteriaceae bacterium Ap0902]
MQITWNNCFSPKRYGASRQDADNRTQYERDWDRIIFSSPFRRLQNKTQVFPLPEEIFVHNRLTHSLEVASVGRSLGHMIGEKLCELNEVKADGNAYEFYRNSLKNVIASACLAHDLGNPAFGHSGEEAISKFFKKRNTENKENKAFRAQFSTQEWQDLTHFEGNANALRILTMQQKGRIKGGFKLTYSTLAAILKYPCESKLSNKKFIHRKKYGFFKIDEKAFLNIAEELNLVRDTSVTNGIAYKRHPFVYLVEAADDIAYNIIDFEDAHRLGILSYNQVRDAFIQLIKANSKADLDFINKRANAFRADANESIAYLRANAIGALTYQCANVFWENRDTILQGDFNQSLINSLPVIQNTLKEIKEVSIDKIYNDRSVVQLELAGFRIMSGLVEDFVTAALTPKQERDTEQKKILSLLPQQFLFEEEDTPYEKTMVMIDFIAGMTDLYALKLYRKSRGIEL